MNHELESETDDASVSAERPDADTYASSESDSVEPQNAPSPRELRRRHLAQVNRMAKERDQALAALEEARASLEQGVEARLEAYERVRGEESARQEFFREKPDAEAVAESLEGLREAFPGMSWRDAYVFHTAKHAPEKLVDAPRLRADREAPRLDTSAYPPSRLRGEPDTQTMSAGEYRRYLDTLLASGKITL